MEAILDTVCFPLFVLTRDFADDRRLINANVGLPIDQPLCACLKALITVLDLPKTKSWWKNNQNLNS